MALEIVGKVVQVLPVQKGEGKNGTPWERGGFVIETSSDRFPKKVCCDVWSDLIGQANALQPGEVVKASIDIDSREYNGRWYTNVRAWRFGKTTEGMEEGASGGAGVSNERPPQATNTSSPDSFNPSPESTDDLPF